MRFTSSAPLIDDRINFWPAYIDMLTSVLMFFLLIYFVEQHLNPERIATVVAQQKRAHFVGAFEREFGSEIHRGDIRLTADLNLLQITFGEHILFDSREWRLRPAGIAVLRRVAGVLRGMEGSGASRQYEQIQIEGHTDSNRFQNASYPRDNWELSTTRALAVMKLLTGVDTGLDDRKMSVNGYGDTRPVGAVLDRNRRIEMRIYFTGKVRPASSEPR